MAYVTRNHYLLLHDALRKVLGPSAQLAAFVKAKKPFQCDMLVNSVRTDPVTLLRDGAAAAAAAGSSSSSTEKDPQKAEASMAREGVKVFARQLQEALGTCDVIAQTRRLDVVFRDRTMLQIALGPDKSDLPFKVTSGADINQERDWRQRNRLRVSLGFDEELFFADCSRSVNVAARKLEKLTYTRCRFSSILLLNPEMAAAFEARGRDWLAVTPPIAYWKVHCYTLDKAYGCRHFEDIAGTVQHNYAEYYGVYPLESPYCPGEDWNTITEAQWLCEAMKTGVLLRKSSDEGPEDESGFVFSTAADGLDDAEGEKQTSTRS